MIILIVKCVILITAFVIGSYKDIKYREIPDVISALIISVGVVGFSPFFSFIGLIITALPFLIAAIVSGGRMGMGDVKLMAACGFTLGACGGTLATIIGLSIAVTYMCCRGKLKKVKTLKDENAPLAPFLCAGAAFSFILLNFGG